VLLAERAQRLLVFPARLPQLSRLCSALLLQGRQLLSD